MAIGLLLGAVPLGLVPVADLRAGRRIFGWFDSVELVIGVHGDDCAAGTPSADGEAAADVGGFSYRWRGGGDASRFADETRFDRGHSLRHCRRIRGGIFTDAGACGMSSSAYDSSIWLTFVLIGLATTLPRASFIVLGNRVVLPLIFQRALRYAPAAALGAIVAPDVLLVAGELQPANPKLIAAAAAATAAMASRNPWMPFLVGMGCLLSLRSSWWV